MNGDMEAAMREPGASRWSYALALAAVAMLVLTILALLVVEFLADHVLVADPDVAWQAQLERVEAALARNDPARSWNPPREELVRIFAARWDARAREVDHLGLMP